jgi:hypothetical protein
MRESNTSKIQLILQAPTHCDNFERCMLDTRIKRLESKEKYHFGLFLLLKEIHNFS